VYVELSGVVMSKGENYTWMQIKRYLFIALGCAIAAFGNARYLGANSIANGGFFGIAVVVQQIIPTLDPGITALVLNIPFLIVSWFVLGKEFVYNTTYATVLFNILVWLFNKYVPYHPTDLLLSAIMGGAIAGVGAAMVFMRNSTTGGTDIVARLFQKYLPHVKIGSMLLIVDAFVIVALMLVKHDINIGYIAIISHVVLSYVIDIMVEGLDLAKIVYILSDRYNEVAKVLMTETGRGITSMKVTGMYSSADKNMLMSVMRVNQLSQLKTLVKQVDPNAFVIVSEAHEVLGAGFKEH